MKSMILCPRPLGLFTFSLSSPFVGEHEFHRLPSFLCPISSVLFPLTSYIAMSLPLVGEHDSLPFDLWPLSLPFDLCIYCLLKSMILCPLTSNLWPLSLPFDGEHDSPFSDWWPPTSVLTVCWSAWFSSLWPLTSVHTVCWKAWFSVLWLGRERILDRRRFLPLETEAFLGEFHAFSHRISPGDS